jgi:hypothetical protein
MIHVEGACMRCSNDCRACICATPITQIGNLPSWLVHAASKCVKAKLCNRKYLLDGSILEIHEIRTSGQGYRQSIGAKTDLYDDLVAI